MKQLILNRAWIAIVLVAGGVGCSQQADTPSASGVAATSATAGPEETFLNIVETFKRGVQDVPIGFVVQDAGGHTMMTGQNKVSHELVPPSKEGEPYRGIITVVSESRYSIQRPVESIDDNSAAGSSASSKSSDGVQIFDSGVVADGRDAAATSAQIDPDDVTVARKVDQEKRKYELVYQNGRWVLTTKLDENTEKSIQYAFDRALENQS